MQSTIQLFHHLYQNLPPLIPAETTERMRQALNLLDRGGMTLEEVEDLMIEFGYEIWSWNQAFKDFYRLAEDQIAEHFLLPKLPFDLQKKYHNFKSYGGSFRDLHSGNPAAFFSEEERIILCKALIETGAELRRYVTASLVAEDKIRYLRKVEEYQGILSRMKSILAELDKMAEAEEYDHPQLAREIKARVRSFEFGLCLLGPEVDHEAVCQSVDFFKGRKHDLNRMRGIHLPVELNLF